MDSDPETAELVSGQSTTYWCGSHTALLGYTVAAGQLYNIVVPVPRPSDAPVAKWNGPGDPNELRALLKDYCPLVQKVLGYVEECNKWTIGDVPKLGKYASENGRLVVVGDAVRIQSHCSLRQTLADTFAQAHAIIPHVGQGGGQALEDAAALAEFVSGMSNKNELALRMQQFQSFRQPRVEIIRRIAFGNQKMFTLPDGPEQVKRDAMLAAGTQKWKAALREHGEEGYRAGMRDVKPDPDAEDIRSPEGRMYLYGYDVVAEVRKVLGQRPTAGCST